MAKQKLTPQEQGRLVHLLFKLIEDQEGDANLTVTFDAPDENGDNYRKRFDFNWKLMWFDFTGGDYHNPNEVD